MSLQDKIDEKLEVWLKQPEIELTELDNNSNIKTNFMWCNRNFVNLRKWLANLLNYVRYLRSLIDIDELLRELFQKLQEEKITIPVLNSMENGEQTTYEDSSSGEKFLITRLNEYTIEISALKDNWKVDKLMVTVKDNDNIINYPTVKTSNNKIIIYFPDRIVTNYKIILL